MNQQLPKTSTHKLIRALRREQEISQLELALQLGISQAQFSLFEQGHADLSEKQLRQIYKILGSGNISTGGRSSD
jgi:transcriptional regulator with XRE-family HTH domain